MTGGHTKAPPLSITYSSVVSRESVRIEFLLVSLNDLDIFACDIGNAYLNAKCREKFWIESVTEFGTEKGMIMIIARALYGLKISGYTWRSKLVETLMSLGYKLSEADADLWMKKEFNPNVDPYYKYMIYYVDYFLHIGFNPKGYMYALNMIYQLKEGFGSPGRYLGANVEKLQLKGGQVVCSTNCVDYLKSATKNVDNLLGVDKTALKNYVDGDKPYLFIFRP